jgi:hypothetical protein
MNVTRNVLGGSYKIKSLRQVTATKKAPHTAIPSINYPMKYDPRLDQMKNLNGRLSDLEKPFITSGIEEETQDYQEV